MPKKYFQLSFSRSFLAGELWNTIMEEDESSNKIDSLLLTPPKKKKKESCFIHVYKGNDLRVRRITDLSLERLKQARQPGNFFVLTFLSCLVIYSFQWLFCKYFIIYYPIKHWKFIWMPILCYCSYFWAIQKENYVFGLFSGREGASHGALAWIRTFLSNIKMLDQV